MGTTAIAISTRTKGIATVTDPEGFITEYTYDPCGNVLTETKPNGAVYQYTYDGLNRLVKATFRETAGGVEVVLEEISYSEPETGVNKKVEKKYLNDTETAETVYTYDYAVGSLTGQCGCSVKASLIPPSVW